MLWIIILMVLQVSCEIPSQQVENRTPSKRTLYNELSITYDHCRLPQKLNRQTWTCECPESLTKRGEECVCENCLFDSSNGSYTEKHSRDLPEYVAGFIKDLNGADKFANSGGISKRLFNAETVAKRKKRKGLGAKKRKIWEYTRQIMEFFGSLCNVDAYSGRRSMIFVRKSDRPLLRLLKGLRIGKYKNPETIRLKKVDWNKARVLNFTRVSNYPFIVRPEMLKDVGKTYSETSIGNVMRGKVHSGDDTAYGLVSNLFGTGSLSMGAGQGSALGSAYTGEGISVAGLHTLGGKSIGVGLIGKKSHRGSSTTTLLIGEGDAIATNSQSKKASASATAVATKKVATAGSTAFGAASAAASATPGKGKAEGSSSFGEALESSAKVTGKSPRIAESASVGNEKDDLRNLVAHQKESRVSDRINRGKILGGLLPTSSDTNALGLSDDDSDDWIK